MELSTFNCLACERQITKFDESMAIYLFAQTVGLKPRQKSTAHQLRFCPTCAVSRAMGPAPEGILNAVAYDMLREIVLRNFSVTQAAWNHLQRCAGEILPPLKSAPPSVMDRSLSIARHPAIAGRLVS